MLSQHEHEDTLWKYNNIPSHFTGKARQNLRRVFRKKLIEHKYASTYPPFTPLSYGIFFINYRTSEENPPNKQYDNLSAEKRRRIHNRSCTLKQRKRYYKSNIIIKNIDRRFSIREIKDILRYKNISFYAVNFSNSSTTNQRNLHIGIRDRSKLSLYKTETQELFTENHYKEFRRAKQTISHHRHHNRDRNHNK